MKCRECGLEQVHHGTCSKWGSDKPKSWGVYPHAVWVVTDHATGDGYPKETDGGYVVREVSPGVPYGRMVPVKVYKRYGAAHKLALKMSGG